MAFIIGIGVVGLIGYGLKLVTDDTKNSRIEINNERNLDDLENNYKIEGRIQELDYLIEGNIQQEIIQKEIKQPGIISKDKNWTYYSLIAESNKI